jgi:rhodanese-related sulfurtransferase
MAARIVYIPKVNPGLIKPVDFQKLAGDTAANALIDVRNPDEFLSGHIPGSINIPENELADNLTKISKDKPVTVFCNSGVRAEMAYNILKNHGYKVHYLDALLHIDKSGAFKITEK